MFGNKTNYKKKNDIRHEAGLFGDKSDITQDWLEDLLKTKTSGPYVVGWVSVVQGILMCWLLSEKSYNYYNKSWF